MAVVPWQRLGVAAYRAKRGLAHNVMNTTLAKGRSWRQTYGVQYKQGAGKTYNPRLKRRARFSAPSAVRPELKFHDLAIADAAIGVTSVIRNLAIIPQGVTESERVGRKVRVKSILWTLSFKIPTSTDVSLSSDIARVMLVQDSQTNGAVFAFTKLFDSDDWHSFRNLAETGRFRILMRREFALKAGGAAGNGTANDSTVVFEPFVGSKAVDIKIQWNDVADTGVIATCTTNNLYLVTQSIIGIIRIEGSVRLRYVDE